MKKNVKNVKNSRQGNYYQKKYEEYNESSKIDKKDIKLEEYFRMRNEADKKSKSEFKSAENPEKMNSRYLYAKNKMLVFQAVSFLLIIAVIISGILFYGANRIYDSYDFFEAAKLDVNMPGVLQTAFYDTDVLAELDARLYGPGGTAKAVSDENVLRIFKKYNMKYIDQNKDNMPNGCEVVSLAMVMSRHLPLITSQEIAENYLPRKPLPVYYEGVLLAEDPSDYYIGDPSGRGYGIFAPGLARTAQAVIDAYDLKLSVINISGCSDETLFYHISGGTPVIIWMTMRLAPVSWSTAWHLPNWKLYKWPNPMHCAVLVDFSDDTVTLYDPTTGIVDYDRELFLQRWHEMGPYEDKTRQAVVIK